MPKGTRNKSNHKAPPRHIILVGQLQFPQKNVVLTIFGTKNTQTCFFREPSMVVKGIRNRSNHMAPRHLGEIAAICFKPNSFGQFWHQKQPNMFFLAAKHGGQRHQKQIKPQGPTASWWDSCTSPKKMQFWQIEAPKTAQTGVLRERNMVIKGVFIRSKHKAPQHLGETRWDSCNFVKKMQFWQEKQKKKTKTPIST